MRYLNVCLAALLFLFAPRAWAEYDFPVEPIDVVIPCVEKDLETLELCIHSIRKYCTEVRHIFVVSEERYTKNARWFPEERFGISKYDIAKLLCADHKEAENFAENHPRIGWIYQKFLKLYAPFVIPNISSNVLVVDADTIFLRKVEFLREQRYGYLATGSQHHKPYFEHMQRTIPGLKRLYGEHSGICHHMLFQRAILDDFIKTIEKEHHKVAWKALVLTLDQEELHKSCMSEYELYFNFALMKTNKVRIRSLMWKNVSSLNDVALARKEGFDFVVCHSYLRHGSK